MPRKGDYVALRERLLSRTVIQPDGCVVWTGAKTKAGYGTIRSEPPVSAHIGAHRAMWELFNGPIPEGLQVDHLCRNRLCLNLSHMELVPPRINILRSTGPAAVNAQKTHCKAGHLLEPCPYRPGERWCRICTNAGQRRRYHGMAKEE